MPAVIELTREMLAGEGMKTNEAVYGWADPWTWRSKYGYDFHLAYRPRFDDEGNKIPFKDRVWENIHLTESNFQTSGFGGYERYTEGGREYMFQLPKFAPVHIVVEKANREYVFLGEADRGGRYTEKGDAKLRFVVTSGDEDATLRMPSKDFSNYNDWRKEFGVLKKAAERATSEQMMRQYAEHVRMGFATAASADRERAWNELSDPTHVESILKIVRPSKHPWDGVISEPAEDAYDIYYSGGKFTCRKYVWDGASWYYAVRKVGGEYVTWKSPARGGGSHEFGDADKAMDWMIEQVEQMFVDEDA